MHSLPKTRAIDFYMHPDIDELLDLISSQLSIEEVLDILDMEFREVLEALKPQIDDHFAVFLKAVR